MNATTVRSMQRLKHSLLMTMRRNMRKVKNVNMKSLMKRMKKLMTDNYMCPLNRKNVSDL